MGASELNGCIYLLIGIDRGGLIDGVIESIKGAVGG